MIGYYYAFYTVITLVLTGVGILTYLKWYYTYWERKGVYSVPARFPFGSFSSPVNKFENFGETIRRLHLDLKKKGQKHGGLYGFFIRIYLPVDLEYIKNILSKDFQYFTDRRLYYNEQDDPLSAHLISIGGDKWKHLRTKLNPAFSSAKLKMMLETVVKCGNNMIKEIDHAHNNLVPVDAKEVFSAFNIEVAGLCGFGLHCNTAEFRTRIENGLGDLTNDKLVRLITHAWPELARWLKIKVLDPDTANFFTDFAKSAIEYRETKNISRQDYLQILIELYHISKTNKDRLTAESKFTIENVAAQTCIYFIAGFDTTSSTLTFCLYELALNTEVQENVRNEIVRMLEKYNGLMTYEFLAELKYMDQVFYETLRMYPTVLVLTRQCTKRYKIPNTNIIIEKGTPVLISTYGLHYDPVVFANPEKFDPQRFSDENKSKIPAFAYMPFGGGPRMCIGQRLADMQNKIALTLLLKDYRFTINSKTPVSLQSNTKRMLFAPKGGIWLNTDKIMQ